MADRRRFAGVRKSLQARLWRLAQRPALPRHRSAISAIGQEYPPDSPVVIFLPGLDWRGPLFQRPQQLARALARLGALVFYVQPEHASLPPGSAAPAAGSAFPSGILPLEPGLYLVHLPLEAFRGIDRPWVHAFTWNEKYTRRFDRARLIYDWVDDLSAFAGRRAALEQQHARLLASAELVLTTARRLWEQAKKSRPDALLCPNGVDFAHFAAARHRGGLPPPDLTPILESGRPIIGYHGALARWFDYELLGAVAARRPDLSFVLVGPDHDRTLAESSLLKQPNLFWLGPKDYQALPAYLAWFEVGIIPFRLNEITHATSPLKLFENLAAGKPVVVTPMQESLDIEGVLAASEADAFSQKLDEALRLKEDPAYLSLIDRVARENTWEARAEQILSRIMPERKHVKPQINSDSHR